jgi:hypothetical protein
MLRAPESARNQPGVPVRPPGCVAGVPLSWGRVNPNAVPFPGRRPRQSRLNVRLEKPLDDRPSALCAARHGTPAYAFAPARAPASPGGSFSLTSLASTFCREDRAQMDFDDRFIQTRPPRMTQARVPLLEA